MTTPRIEEFKKLYGGQKWVYANEELVLDFFRQALTEAHQAGIDEAVEVIANKKRPNAILGGRSQVQERDNYFYNQALDDTIKALQDNM